MIDRFLEGRYFVTAHALQTKCQWFLWKKIITVYFWDFCVGGNLNWNLSLLIQQTSQRSFLILAEIHQFLNSNLNVYSALVMDKTYSSTGLKRTCCSGISHGHHALLWLVIDWPTLQSVVCFSPNFQSGWIGSSTLHLWKGSLISNIDCWTDVTSHCAY